MPDAGAALAPLTQALRRPFEPLDKACLAATLAPWSSFAPTWRLEFRGALTLAVLERALGWLVTRYPFCGARTRGDAWVLPGPDANPPRATVLDLREAPPAERAAREQALADRFLDLEREAPLAVTWVRRSNDAGVLVLQQHHALADGRAFLSLVGDLILCLDAAEAGTAASPLPAGAVPRRREREVLDEHGLGRWWGPVRGALHSLAELVRAVVAPPAPLASNRGTDYTGGNRTRHLEVPLSRVEAWRPRRTARGLSSNDVLAGALCTALHRWSVAEGLAPGTHTLLMPIDVRPREGFESFANHLSSVQVRWRPAAGAGPLELAAQLKQAAAPLLASRLPWRRVGFDGLLVGLTPLSALRRALLVQRRLVTNYSFSNLVPLGTPGADASGRWRTGSLTVERLLITTPCAPPQAANTTVVRFGDTLCFNFNFKVSALAEAQVEALVAAFSSCLDEVDRALLP